MIWNEARECMSRDELNTLQSARLKKVVNRVYHNVEPYRKRMQEAGLELGDITNIEDITKLPFTEFVFVKKLLGSYCRRLHPERYRCLGRMCGKMLCHGRTWKK